MNKSGVKSVLVSGLYAPSGLLFSELRPVLSRRMQDQVCAARKHQIETKVKFLLATLTNKLLEIINQ